MWAAARRVMIASLVVLIVAVARAAVPADLDPAETDGVPAAVSIDAGADTPVARKPPVAEPTGATSTPPQNLHPAYAPSGNPLWAVPLKQLSATRERPIFSPSRRPPQTAVATAPYVPPPAPPQPVELPRPQLSLVGTISGGVGFGIFVEQVGDKALRLKTGEAHMGWTLLEVRARQIVLQKDNETITLSLPAPGLAQTTGSTAADTDANPAGGSQTPNVNAKRDR